MRTVRELIPYWAVLLFFLMSQNGKRGYGGDELLIVKRFES
jgi:hypothetical protein